MTEIYLGTDLSFATKVWPETDRWIDIVKNHLGLEIVEFNSDFLDPLFNKPSIYLPFAEEVATKCKKEGIKIHNYFTGEMTHCINFLTHPDKRLREAGIKWSKGAIDIAKKMKAKAIGSNFNNIPFYVLRDRDLYKKTIDYLIDSLAELGSYGQKIGLDFLLWEQMYSPAEVPYTIEQTKDYFARLNEKSRLPFKLVLDVGHACCQNFEHTEEDRDPYKWIEKCGCLTEVIHIQQTNDKASQHLPFTEENNRMGIIDPERVLDAIDKSGMDKAYLIMEIFFPLQVDEKKILSDMVESVEYWKKYV
jgi:D-erythrulose 1-phosphate 3-epimerase